MDDIGPDEIAARRSLIAKKASVTRSKNIRERRERDAKKRVDAAQMSRETMRRETASGALDPVTDVERAVVRTARAAQARARRAGIDWDIDLPRLMLQRCRAQDASCALSGVSFSMESRGHGAAPRPFAPSIDRIDSRGGYTTENCRLIAWALNIFFGVWGSDVALELVNGLSARMAAVDTRDSGTIEDPGHRSTTGLQLPCFDLRSNA